jgi:hypothetical protein
MNELCEILRIEIGTIEMFAEWWSNFRRSGDIGNIRAAMHRDELKELLGEPDDVGGTSRKRRMPRIWKYGSVEFHFGDEDDLRLVYFEDDEGNANVVLQKET